MSDAKKPKRFTSKRKPKGHPAGSYTSGIKNQQFAEQLGLLVSYWNHVEESMIDVFRDLLGGGNRAPGRQIFRAITGNQSRIKVMKVALEQAPINSEKSNVYDYILDQFQTLNQKRNDYVHGLWFSHEATGRAFLSARATDDLHFMEQREVGIEELKDFILEMGKLINLINWNETMRRMPKRQPEHST